MNTFSRMIFEDRVPRYLLSAWGKNTRYGCAFVDLERKIRIYYESKNLVAKYVERGWQMFFAFLSATVFMALALNNRSFLLGVASAALVVLGGYFVRKSRLRIKKNLDINRDFYCIIDIPQDIQWCAMDL